MTTIAERILKRSGHRLTGTRLTVVEALDREQPCSIEELCTAVPSVGRATVFRTMKLLQELDVVCRVPLEDGAARYRLSDSDAHHHHLVCRGCGAVQEFSDPALDRRIAARAEAADFRLEGHAVELYGTCANCR